ncbi:hypothetical protein RI578_01675 [Streptomyces sp. BB1-1-1]|uniref:hypothetical protein n=2 Tax=Streptomyces TaxID=1883 RepID=UPI002877D130|nr:hypothetical protein [Streptomyces sp. BB1-1-1]WND33068.1 hypothetical protein RI578_01675 [Streptomyces sp. BB1-1-1]
MVVLIVDGTAFEPTSPVHPSNPCPASAASKKGVYPTVYTEDAKPYAGTGPHTVELRFHLDHKSLPARWSPPDNKPHTAQLILCEYVEETGLTDTQCDYRGHDQVWLMQARATYLLLEAKTSELITSFKVDGATTCPAVLSYDPDGPRPTHVRAAMDEAEIIRNLRPYVEGERKRE